MKKKKVIIISGIVVLLATVIFTSYSYANVKKWDNLILPIVKIENEDLTGKTKEEAQNIVKEKYSSQIIKKKINILAGDKNYSLDYSMLDAKYDINEALEKAMSYGKNMNMFQKFKATKNPVLKQIELKFEYNDKYIDEIIEQIAKDTNKKAVDATVNMISSGIFSVTSDSVGRQLDSAKLKTEIISKINGKISEDTISIQAPIEEIKPKVTSAILNSIDRKISSFSTNFSSSSDARATNIVLSTKSINGKLLMPGEVFSFNEVVGERTAQKGYQSAGIIVGDKLEEGLGGGICQVSSTLYNAVLSTELLSVERIHHTFPSSYVPIGQDATVDYGNLDYKFKNTYSYPIFIEGVISSRNLYFNIYSNSTLAKKNYVVTNEILERIEPKTENKPDPTKYVGEIEVVQKAYTGYKVRVTRKTYENGTLINTEIINNDTYKVINGLIKEGTKVRVVPPAVVPVLPPAPIVPTVPAIQ